MVYNAFTLNFIIETGWVELPGYVQHQSKRCLLDTLGAQIAGHQTPVGHLMTAFQA